MMTLMRVVVCAALALLRGVRCGEGQDVVDVSRMMATLSASVDDYDSKNHVLRGGSTPKSVEKWLRSYLWDKKLTVLVLDGRVIVDEEFVASSGEKGHKHLRFVESLRGLGVTLPNAVYRFSSVSTGACANIHEPCFVIAKDARLAAPSIWRSLVK